MEGANRPSTAAVALQSGSRLLDELKAESGLSAFANVLNSTLATLNALVADTKVNYEQSHYDSQCLERLRGELSAAKGEEDELVSTAESLQEECAKLRSSVGKAQIAQACSEATARDMRSRVEALRVQLELGSDWTPDQRHRRHELESQRMLYLADLETQRAALLSLRSDVATLNETVDAVHRQKVAADRALSDCHDDIAEAKNAISTGNRAKQTADLELRDAQLSLVALRSTATEREAQAQTARVGAQSAQDTLRRDKETVDDSSKTCLKLKARAVKLKDDIELQHSTNATLADDVKDIGAKSGALASDAIRAAAEEERLAALLDLAIEKVAQAEQRRSEAETKRAALVRDQQEADALVNAARKAKEAKQGVISAARRERDVIRKALTKAGDKSKELAEALEAAGADKQSVIDEIGGFQQSLLRLREQITELKVSKADLRKQCEGVAQAYFTAVESLKLQELQYAALQRRLEEGKDRLKQQQSLYESAKLDRTMLGKKVTEAQLEINELKRKFRSQKIAIDKLKDDITVKDQDLVKEHFEHHKVGRCSYCLEMYTSPNYSCSRFSRMANLLYV